VPSVKYLRCSKCDEVLLRFQDARRLYEDAIAIYNVQTAAMDILLRLIRDLPGSVSYLRKLAA
jgi:hypothetical protein